MDHCPDAMNRAKRVRWAIDAGVKVTDDGQALVAQMEAAGVDLYEKPVRWEP